MLEFKLIGNYLPALEADDSAGKHDDTCERSILTLGKLHRRGAFRVVVPNMVDATAHRIAAHEPSIAGLQQVGCRTNGRSISGAGRN